MEFSYAEIENKIGYVFQDKTLLKTAFVHSTYGNARGVQDNELMEYLGDSVLQLVITEWQYKERLGAEEGVLTKERQRLVCEEALDEAVRRLGLEKYLLKVGSFANIGRKTISSLFEALVAAIYLDGGYEKAKTFILGQGLENEVTEMKNPKGLLQEYLQQNGEALPVYESQKKGKDNAPTFYCKVTAMGKQATGDGKSKREAEQDAAAKLFLLLTEQESKNVCSKKRKK